MNITFEDTSQLEPDVQDDKGHEMIISGYQTACDFEIRAKHRILIPSTKKTTVATHIYSFAEFVIIFTTPLAPLAVALVISAVVSTTVLPVATTTFAVFFATDVPIDDTP